MKVDAVKSDIPQPLANYTEAFRAGGLVVRTKTSKNIPGGLTVTGIQLPSSTRRTGKFQCGCGRMHDGGSTHNDIFTLMQPVFCPVCRTPCTTERSASFFRPLTIL